MAFPLTHATVAKHVPLQRLVLCAGLTSCCCLIVSFHSGRAVGVSAYQSL